MNPTGPATMTKEETAALFARVEERVKEAKRYVMGFVILNVAESESLLALAQTRRDDPEVDATDFARPAWWRAEESTTAIVCGLINDILDGRDAGHGTSREPWHSTRQRLVALAQAKGGGKDLGDEPYDSQPAIWAAEREVGRWVYRRIETLAEAKPETEPGTREGDELNYLADVVIDVEEYGATGEHPVEAAPPSPPSPSPWPSEAIEHPVNTFSDAFELGFVWRGQLTGQTLEDSRALGRTLTGPPFDALRLDLSQWDSFTTADIAVCEGKRRIKAALDSLAASPPPAVLPDEWRPIDDDTPKDTAILVVHGWGHDIAHFNTSLNAWVACWDHRRITTPTAWMPLPAPPSPKTGG